MLLYHRVMCPNDADGMANSVDPDQTAPLGAVWSGSALFAQAYLSEKSGTLRYALQIFCFHVQTARAVSLSSLPRISLQCWAYLHKVKLFPHRAAYCRLTANTIRIVIPVLQYAIQHNTMQYNASAKSSTTYEKCILLKKMNFKGRRK